MGGRPYGRWLYAVAAFPPGAAVLAVVFAPDPYGHWTEHLWGAYLKGAQLVLLAVLATLLGWRELVPWLAVALGVAAAGIVIGMVGDYEVAESIWRTTGDRGFGTGYDRGHDLAEIGDLLVVAGGAAFALVVGLSRRVPFRIALLALVMVVVPPPFVWPAAGVLMVMLYRLTSDAGLDERLVRPRA